MTANVYPDRSAQIRKNILQATLAFLPALIIIWTVPWFVTQDGPLHLYNAYASSEIERGNELLASAYQVREGFIPYLTGYKLIEGLLAVVSPRTADRVVMSITLLGVSASVLWLRWRVAGWAGMQAIIPLALLLGLTRLWLLGLYNFLLGVILFPLTLGIWWKWRNEMNPLRALMLAALLVAGYFFHLITATITVAALIVVAVATPGDNIKKRLLWTAAAILPAVIMLARFGLQMQSSGTGPDWTGLADATSLVEWLRYLQAPDFVTISFKTAMGDWLLVQTDCPFVDEPAYQYAALAPGLWLVAGLGLLVGASMPNRTTVRRLISSEHRGWALLALGLLLGGLFGPNSVAQGSIIRERLLLLACISLTPILRVPSGSAARIGTLCLAVAAVLQFAFVFDYALGSNRVAGSVMQARPFVGENKRLGLIMADSRVHYFITPLPNIGNQLGVETGSVVWNNWGPQYYFYPLAYRDEVAKDRCFGILELNELFITGQAEKVAAANRERWITTFDNVFQVTDVLIVWGEAPWFDEINSTWYKPEPVYQSGGLRVFVKRD